MRAKQSKRSRQIDSPKVAKRIVHGAIALSILASPIALPPPHAMAASGPYSMNLEYKDIGAEAERNFISNLKEMYLTEEVKQKAVIGLEVEMNGLSPQKVIEILQNLFGGTVVTEGTQLVLKSSTLGEIKVYRDGDMWMYNDWVNEKNGGRENLMRKVWYTVRSALRDSVEAVFPPLPYDKAIEVEKAIAEWAKAGAVGSKGMSGAALQVSLTNDPKNSRKIKNLHGNYTNNARAFTKYFKPVFVRRGSNLPLPGKDLQAKHADYSYQPTPGEFWVDFRNSAHVKFSRMNIGPALLADLDVDAETKKQLRDAGWSSGNRTELREANSVMVQGYLTEVVNAALAIDAASESTSTLNARDLQTAVELKRMNRGIGVRVAGQIELDKAPFTHTLKQTLEQTNFVEVNRFATESTAAWTYLDKDKLVEFGLVNPNRPLAELKQSFQNRFGFEYVRPEEEVGQKGKETPNRTTERVEDGQKLMALAYDDGYLGRGDGRASWLMEFDVPGVGVLDIGDKGGGPTTYTIPQESIDAGFHVAEKDGLLSLEEAAIVSNQSKTLRAVGIDSEQILGFVENGKITGKNLTPPVEMPTAKVLRMFENGLRGAHLRKYSADEMRRVSYFLRSREAVRLGRDRNDVTPLDVYLENKVKRDAVRAALAQHFWIVHGAINPANLYENGWADIMYSDVLRRPDGHFTHMNVYARFENQMNEFFKVTDQFVRALSSTDPTVKVDHKKIFWQEYETELTRLELIGLGLNDAEARSLMKSRPDLAKRYTKLVWDMNYNHLETNSRMLRAEVMEVLKDRMSMEVDLTPNLEALVNRSKNAAQFGEREEVAVHEMFRKDRIFFRIKERVKKLLGQEQNQVSEVPAAKAGQMLEVAEQVVRALGKQNDKAWLTQAATRAQRITEISLPNRAENEGLYLEYVKSGSKDFNRFAAPMIERINRASTLISTVYGDLTTASREYRGKVRVTNPKLRLVKPNEFALAKANATDLEVAAKGAAPKISDRIMMCRDIFSVTK